ncbi:hypothetical protein [Bradyrhizobium elkanii]|uniref:hypothetical protein n=1 Tax=Bradyrhizobium elkanii TaxID=29448 RepID=UPI00272CEE46|nr:hypothetical protein [Bradyrhizobium elkanii]WLA80333.1 hypothetical protein QNJ99_33850 [Bradyrhizobium elkanii]
MAAITATLARYPEDVIKAVTHPATGLPTQKDFLPTVREVFLACEAIMQPRREAQAREARLRRQLEERAEFERKRSSTGERIQSNEDAA